MSIVISTSASSTSTAFGAVPLEVVTHIFEFVCSVSMVEAPRLRLVHRTWRDAVAGLTDLQLSTDITAQGVWTPQARASTKKALRVRNRLILWRIPQLPPEVLCTIRGVDWGSGWTSANSKLPCLRYINVEWCTNLSDQGVAFLAHGPPLEQVDFSRCTKLTDAALLTLSSIPTLWLVRIVGCTGVSAAMVRNLRPDIAVITV
jgi:hypothetical protein